jgi:hypothetical protein
MEIDNDINCLLFPSVAHVKYNFRSDSVDLGTDTETHLGLNVDVGC